MSNVAVKQADLDKLCRKIPYTKSKILTDEIYDQSANTLKELWARFGYSDVLGKLSEIWPSWKAIPFFEKYTLSISRNLSRPADSHKVIATYYKRIYNGGVERVLAQLMNLWVYEMGYRVILFTEEPENKLDFSYPPSVKRVIIPTADRMQERLFIIQRTCIDEGVNLYINHMWHHESVLWELLLLKMIHIPFAVYVHGNFSSFIWKSKHGLYQPELFKMCDVVLSLSETNARFFQLCGCKSYMVQNPIPEDLSNNTVVSSLSSNHVLMIGRLSAEKHPMDCLNIFKLVHDSVPDAILDIVGGDDNGNYYTSQMNIFVKENNLDSCVIFHGKKKQTEIAEFYKKSSCVILTSEMEGYGMVILEAKAYGLPLVMYELPYLTLVKDGRGILNAKQGDIQTMADNLIKVLSDDSLRFKLGKEARESFESFKAYDLAGAWENVISIATEGKPHHEDKAYFNPEDTFDADEFVVPMLLDAMKKEYDNMFCEYRIGKKLLQYPRMAKAIIMKIKRTLKSLR